jgi:hypothetical protein
MKEPEGGVSPRSTPGDLDAFEGDRRRLTGLAYRITGSLADAEDVVQEVWMRWAARDDVTVVTAEAVDGRITSIWVRLNPGLTPTRPQRSRTSRRSSEILRIEPGRCAGTWAGAGLRYVLDPTRAVTPIPPSESLPFPSTCPS